MTSLMCLPDSQVSPHHAISSEGPKPLYLSAAVSHLGLALTPQPSRMTASTWNLLTTIHMPGAV